MIVGIICFVELDRGVFREIMENILGCKILLEYILLYRRIFCDKVIFCSRVISFREYLIYKFFGSLEIRFMFNNLYIFLGIL